MKKLIGIVLITLIFSLSGCDDITELATYQVTFESNGGSTIDNVTVQEGHSITEPTLPSKENYSFEGWFSDSSLNVAYDFSKPVAGDIVLHAKWSPVEVTVTFRSNATDVLSETTCQPGDDITVPSPTLPNFSLEGWSLLDSDVLVDLIGTCPEVHTIYVPIFKDSYAPFIGGVEDVTLVIHTNFNPMEGVYAVDNVDSDVTSSIAFSGSVDTETAGVYTLEYTAIDSAGNLAEITRTITVSAETLIIMHNRVELAFLLEEYATEWGAENGYTVEVITCGGDTCAYYSQLMVELSNSSTPPDIFVIEGVNQYNEYKDLILDLTGEDWTDNTDLEFVQDGKAYGFPISIEGWGLAYNQEILEAAFALEGIGRTIDSLKDVSQAEYEEVFQAIEALYASDSMYDDYAVISMASAPYMTWVTGLHNFNGYLSSGLAYTDSTIIDDLNNGIVDETRLSEFADWVELLFTYSDKDILLYGSFDDQVGKFGEGEAAFLHQGNWVDFINLYSDFDMGFLPHAAMATGNDAIFVGVPAYYVINEEGANTEAAKQFLSDFVLTEEGQQYYQDSSVLIPAFHTMEVDSIGKLGQSVFEWTQSGHIYAWWQNELPAGFGMDVLGPIYGLFAMDITGESGGITKAEFIEMIINEIDSLQ